MVNANPNDPPVNLLFVSETNIRKVVNLVAPQFVLLNRAQFELVAKQMCDMADEVAKQRGGMARVARRKFVTVAEEMLELIEGAAGA